MPPPGKPRVIDAHIHIQPWDMLKAPVRETMRKGREDWETILACIRDPGALIEHLDREGVFGVAIINYTSPDVMGFMEEVNAWCGRYCARYPDRLFPFGSVHPRFVKDAESATKRLLDEHGVKGVKIHPPHQLVFPNAYRDGGDWRSLETIYSICQERRVPVMFHTGTSIFPGARNKYGDPMPIDDVAVDFPELPIVLAHGGRPLWMDTAMFLLRRHPNTYLDLSSIPPQSLLRYFPALESIAHKTLFGTDWPAPKVPAMSENVRRFRELPLSEAAKDRILFGTAAALYGIG
jgi:predicted TIM-barrel fold metal-dependent hydrolase